MWVLPKNYQPSSAFVADTVESKEELSLLESSIESSLMWRSKPSPLRTWLLRWNRVNWIPLLFGRILKPSQHTYFEEQLTLSLAGIRASRSLQQEEEKESEDETAKLNQLREDLRSLREAQEAMDRVGDGNPSKQAQAVENMQGDIV